ncbi:selenium metabolism protein YedF [Desulfobaculum xiamenense]|uniref:Selenium metabolism protein YedF n=1 Tax=Desulfobaculum xiamenense TaxID=995050 RepID=A0A846QNM7_9BACT|nr:sulfurtransferase-like selenium metabolism protein YedF [Desulfobaculum xiamenense]NJB66824.1 selenium metabolism protein YedF [Desulfobaculum xiamenense]
MTRRILDCKGLACPQPVLNARKLVETEQPAEFAVIVDNEAARENVGRFIATRGYETSVENVDGGWAVVGRRAAESSDAAPSPAGACPVCRPMSADEMAALEQKVTVFIQRDVLGSGDDALGEKLMLNFLATLPEFGPELWRVVLVNGGVRLTVADNPCCEKIKALEEMGATILVCGTCLDHFGLLDRKAVGETTNMLDVVTSLQLATKVITV